ncbi:MAG: hypothetical protein EXS05_21685 [Planctomycetaceae bacterium]|nr:hypothetical protein [Planctomycetaceae bacterium]
MNNVKKYSNEKIIDSLQRTYGKVYLAAERLGCSAGTIYKRAKVVKQIADAIDHYSGHILDSAEVHLARAIQSGESWAVRFVLKTLGQKRGYSDRVAPSPGADPFDLLRPLTSREERRAIRQYLTARRTDPTARLIDDRKPRPKS